MTSSPRWCYMKRLSRSDNDNEWMLRHLRRRQGKGVKYLNLWLKWWNWVTIIWHRCNKMSALESSQSTSGILLHDLTPPSPRCYKWLLIAPRCNNVQRSHDHVAFDLHKKKRSTSNQIQKKRFNIRTRWISRCSQCCQIIVLCREEWC